MRILLLILIALYSQQAGAFGQTGHKMICELAYQISQPQTQVQIDKLVKASGLQNFAEGCVWPDTLRDNDSFKWSAPLHYVNFARNKTTVTSNDCAKYGCVLSAITDMQQRLNQDNNDWQALLFLAHFIADLHQPLHVSYADDLGGNKTQVIFYQEATNLHSVWDSRIITKLGYNNNPAKQKLLLQAITSKQAYQWQQGGLIDWANESAALTINIYAHYQPKIQLGDAYIKQYQGPLETRLQQATVRLALILDQVFSYKP